MKCSRLQCRHSTTQGRHAGALREVVIELKQCGKRKELQGGKILHRNAVESGYDKNRYVAHALISMYSKCCSMRDAQDVFVNMASRDVVSWNSLMLGYVENREYRMVFYVLANMDCVPDCVTFVVALKACAGTACLLKGMAIHRQARDCGFDKDVFVATTLVDMYSKCGGMHCAWDVFQNMTERDAVSWNALMLGYVENGESHSALEVFIAMDCAPDVVSFIAALKACAGLAKHSDKKTCLEKGMGVHREAKEKQFDKDLVVTNTLVDMYSNCGSMLDAQKAFENMSKHDVVSWTALILGYVENGEALVALDVFDSMDCEPDRRTLIAAIKACASWALVKETDKKVCMEKGMAIHRLARERGCDEDVYVAGSLVDMYGKCGSMQDARDVFENTPQHDVVLWNSLILGYVENG